MIHNRVSSVMNLARVVRDGIDDSKIMTPVQTKTLRLLLDTLIELGAPSHHAALDESARRSVEAMIAPPILDDRGGNGVR